MPSALHVNKYQVAVSFREGRVSWVLALETEDGRRHEVTIRDSEEIDVVLALLQQDETVFFDPATSSLSTGWNNPGA